MKYKHKNITFEDFQAPSYKDIVANITKRVGTQPKIPSDLQKGNWSEQAIKVLKERYLLRDKQGKVYETPEEMCWRVAWDIASAESTWGASKGEVTKSAREFYDLMIKREFLPNSPTLMNAGTGNMLQYSACFVLPVEDSLEGIYDAIKYQALIHKTGGGTGFSFTRLRPSGAIVNSSRGVASGPVSFMKIFDASTNEIKQGGKRRGANMGILRVDHPDIIQFIHCKDGGGITNFNISVAITDKFMKAYKRDEDYDLVDPKTGKKTGSLSARAVFDEIAESAWETGDPGVIFLDRRNRGTSNPVPSMGPIEATNPCGEQELYPYDACNLGSIFLTRFIKNEKGKKVVDWDKLRHVSRIAARFLDNVIEVNPYPLEQIRKTVFGIRRIGLGVGGWADMLIELGMPYDSEEALILGEKVMKVINEEGSKMSEELALTRGAFPMWHESIYADSLPRRNSTVTTIAPTGTISIIAGSSSGVEPLFAIAFQHVVKDESLDRTLTFMNPQFEKVARDRGILDEDLKKKVSEHGVIRDIVEIPKEIRDIFGTAHEIAPDWHIKMQSAFQKHTDNAVSKTINLEHTATVEDIKNAYLLAWDTDCKGITVFRDGCKDHQVLNLGIKDNDNKVVDDSSDREPARSRPIKVVGATYKLNTPVGTAFITINEDENGQPIEVFVNVGKAGSDVQAMAEALGRTISISLRFKGLLSPRERAQEIAHQLAGIGGRRSVGFGPNKILSLPDAIAAALAWHYNLHINGFQKAAEMNGVSNGLNHSSGEIHIENLELTNNQNEQDLSYQFMEDKHLADICPSCGSSSFVFEEGCSKCMACGHSEC